MSILVPELQSNLSGLVFEPIHRFARLDHAGRFERFDSSVLKSRVSSFGICSRKFGSRIQSSRFWIVWTRALGWLELMNKDRMPNQTPEPTADKASDLPRSVGFASVVVRLWLSFIR